MMAAICFGAGTGIGLWILLVWATPPRPALRPRIAHSTTAPEPKPTEGAWATVVVRPLLPGLRALGLPGARIERDLAMTGRGSDTHLATKVLLAMAGLVIPVLGQALLALGGLSPGFETPLVAAVTLAALGFLAPDIRVRSRAKRLRAQFRTALSAFLDLVGIALAGGAGVETALAHAASIGHGPAFTRLQRAITAAQATRTTLWHTLGQLGDELDITELSELAASLSLAGTEGARVRASLASKAHSLRTHQLTAAETEAQSATERMAAPVAVLFLAFLGFIAYPSVLQVLNDL